MVPWSRVIHFPVNGGYLFWSRGLDNEEEKQMWLVDSLHCNICSAIFNHLNTKIRNIACEKMAAQMTWRRDHRF